LLVSLLAYIYLDEIKSFISEVGKEVSVDPLKITFLVLTLLAAAILLYRVIKFLRTRKQVPSEFGEKHIEGIEFFTSREELRKKYPLKDFLMQAKNRIVILGGSLEYVIVQNRKTIWEILDKRIPIEFILQNPSWVSSTKLNKEIAFTPLEGGIARSLGVLCSIKNELDTSKKSGCVIKTYEIHATYSGMIIDPDSSESKVLVELCPYDTQAESRPIVVIHRKENEALFKTWWHSCESVSDKAKEYTCPKTVEKSEKTDSKSRAFNWRDGVRCRKCKRLFDFQHRPEKVKVSKDLDSVTVWCPYCEYKGAYRREEWIQNLYDNQQTKKD